MNIKETVQRYKKERQAPLLFLFMEEYNIDPEDAQEVVDAWGITKEIDLDVQEMLYRQYKDPDLMNKVAKGLEEALKDQDWSEQSILDLEEALKDQDWSEQSILDSTLESNYTPRTIPFTLKGKKEE